MSGTGNHSGSSEPLHVDVEQFKGSPPSDNPLGATILTAYAKRQVKAYPIFETEVRTIAMFNTLATACFSIGSAFISFAVAIWVTALFTTELTPEGNILSHFVAPSLCVACAVTWGFGIWAVVSRVSTWKAIREESEEAE